VEIHNRNATLTWTSPKLWLGVDLRGASVSVGLADGGVARALSYGYTYHSPAAPGSYTTPTDYAGGLSLPTLAALQKCLVTLRRDPTSAGVAYPENNALYVRGTSPI
jgi:hypothetical protein